MHYVRARAANIKQKMKKMGLLPDERITREYLVWLAAAHPNCECCKKKLDMDTKEQTKPDRITIDRKDNGKGYIVENLGVLCYRCNILKSDGTVEEFQRIIDYMIPNS